MGAVTPMTIPQFKWWLEHGNTKKPIKDGLFANVKTKTAADINPFQGARPQRGSFYVASIPGTPSTYSPNISPVQNLVRQLGAVRGRGDQAIREAYQQEQLANAADPNRVGRQFSAYLAGKRKPVVHHWFDRMMQGDL
jgi:hypothetical protein